MFLEKFEIVGFSKTEPNSSTNSIHYMFEYETEDQLPFLDVLDETGTDNDLQNMSIHCKSRHTGL